MKKIILILLAMVFCLNLYSLGGLDDKEEIEEGYFFGVAPCLSCSKDRWFFCINIDKLFSAGIAESEFSRNFSKHKIFPAMRVFWGYLMGISDTNIAMGAEIYLEGSTAKNLQKVDHFHFKTRIPVELGMRLRGGVFVNACYFYVLGGVAVNQCRMQIMEDTRVVCKRHKFCLVPVVGFGVEREFISGYRVGLEAAYEWGFAERFYFKDRDGDFYNASLRSRKLSIGVRCSILL